MAGLGTGGGGGIWPVWGLYGIAYTTSGMAFLLDPEVQYTEADFEGRIWQAKRVNC